MVRYPGGEGERGKWAGGVGTSRVWATMTMDRLSVSREQLNKFSRAMEVGEHPRAGYIFHQALLE